MPSQHADPDAPEEPDAKVRRVPTWVSEGMRRAHKPLGEAAVVCLLMTMRRRGESVQPQARVGGSLVAASPTRMKCCLTSFSARLRLVLSGAVSTVLGLWTTESSTDASLLTSGGH